VDIYTLCTKEKKELIICTTGIKFTNSLNRVFIFWVRQLVVCFFTLQKLLFAQSWMQLCARLIAIR